MWFAARSRSTYAVIRVLEAKGSQRSTAEADRFILRGLKELTEAHFVESVIQWGDPNCVADVYGLIFDGSPWYVKFRIDTEEQTLEEISFHPPEKELTTVGGLKIPKGEVDHEK